MEKITRKAFSAALCEHKTIFFGAPRHDASWINDRLENAIAATDFHVAEKRTARQRSNGLEFSNGSKLWFDQKCEKTCYHAEKSGKHAYMFEEKIYDPINEKEKFITCVYIIAE